MRGIGGNGIPIAQPDKLNPGWWQPGVTHYTIDLAQFEDQLHPDLPNPTRLWGFGQGNNFKHLGGVIAAKKGEPVQITFRNKLPKNHILPVDTTIMGAELNQNRCDVHLHGGKVPWLSDGGPHAWWDPYGNRGASFMNVLNPKLGNNEGEYYYPNNQSARLMWYHDHALGITRLNAYAGIATGYVIYDDYELSLVKYGLPGPLDPRTLYMVFQDKSFVTDQTALDDPNWYNLMPHSRPGDLWYAHAYDPADLWEGSPEPAEPSEVPEFFGGIPLVNGLVQPYLEVEPRQYRIRMLNACNARFLNPTLYFALSGDSTQPDLSKPGPGFIQIGTEGGFLPAPVIVNQGKGTRLLLAPAERADLIVDFRSVPAGSVFILNSDALAPYPMGDPPAETTLLQIKVVARKGAADPAIKLPSQFTPTEPFLVKQQVGQPYPVPAGVPVRYLTLNETYDQYGRLIQFLGDDERVEPRPDGTMFGEGYMEKPTELIQNGAMEVWEILNLTGDTHPIHFHIVNGQVLSRRPFDDVGYLGGAPSYTGGVKAPDPNELGWKETVRMNPGETTRMLFKFDMPTYPNDIPFKVPFSPRLKSDYGIDGHEYVWHCHILEHEEHDMMRPLVVT
jgi:spore coat protein A